MGKASNQKKKRRQGTGASRADLEGQRAWEQLARAAGACCLVDATWAVVGLDPLRDVLDYLGPRLDAALAELDCTLKPSGKMLAGTLLRAAADFYRLDEEPADAETMRQLGGKSDGNPLDCLISEKAIEPADMPTIGLAVIATLADLCRTAEASVRVPR
jgi:hypothetical protein